jgi:hypothetical protein
MSEALEGMARAMATNSDNWDFREQARAALDYLIGLAEKDLSSIIQQVTGRAPGEGPKASLFCVRDLIVARIDWLRSLKGDPDA